MVSVKSSNFPLAVFTPAAAPPGTCVPSPTWLTNPHRFPWGPPEPDRLHPGLSGRGFHPRFCRFTAEPDSSSSGTHLGCQVPTEGKDGGNTHGFTFLLTYLLTYFLLLTYEAFPNASCCRVPSTCSRHQRPRISGCRLHSEHRPSCSAPVGSAFPAPAQASLRS